MLNGKFFTGLPPKMLERTAGTPNRLESHIFWPDDTQVETPHETRTRRRSSLQTETPRNATTYQRQSSWTANNAGIGENEVDTKQRFQKEFAKSSITFCDNIQEEDAYGQRPTTRRHHKQDITTKPTAIKMQLPNKIETNAQDEYAANQKKQAFTSKIQFYDYVDDEAAGARRNNQIKPKLDMNDKIAVERHTKNSPKLQVKGIERNLRMVNEQRNNEREHRLTPENIGEHFDDIERSNSGSGGARIIRNEVRAVGGRSNVGQRQRERYESPKRGNTNYRHEFEETDAYNERQSAPKTILKQPTNIERDYNEYDDGFQHELEHLEHTTRNMRLREAPKKHVSYGDEVFEHENQREDYDDARNMHSNYREYGHETRGTTARNGAIINHSSRNEIRTVNRQTTGNNKPTRNGIQQIDEQIDHKSARQTNARNFNKNNENSKLNNQQHRSTPKMSLSVGSTAASTTAANDSAINSPTSPTLDSQKHLRSSLCFSGGEIVANNNNNRGSTPTTESGSRNRTARSAATTRRICVGLPD